MGLTWTDSETAVTWVRQVSEETLGSFQVNFALHFPPTALHAVLDVGVPCVTFSWGDPAPYAQAVRDSGASLGIQVVSAQGALQALELQPDYLICQGIEAGGHVQSSSALQDLLPKVVAVAGSVPVIAAGGIGDAAAIRRVLDLGASGAMLGTRFVATQESRAHEQYKKLLMERKETALTVCFDGDWPYASHRVIRNSTLESWEAAGSPPVGKRPGEGETVATSKEGNPIARYDEASPQHGMSGDIEAMCLYAGTGIEAIHDLPKAGDLVADLWQVAETLILE